MRYLTTLVIPLTAWAVLLPQRAAGSELYLLAASAVRGDVTYPADLYRIGQKGKLQLVRNVSPASGGVAFVLAAPDALVVAHPQVFPRTFDIVHFADPLSADTVKLPASERQVVTGFVVQAGGRTLAALRMTPASGQTWQQSTAMGIDLDGFLDPKQRLTDPLPWSDLAGEQYEGAPGGQLYYTPALLTARLTEDGWVAYIPEGPVVVLAPASLNRPPAVQVGRATAVLCANAQFMVMPLGDLKTHAEVLQRTTYTAAAVNRHSGDWRVITIPGGQSRLRIFGSWLAVLVVESANGHTTIAGAENQGRKETVTHPSVHGTYERALGDGEWLPGELLLINLDTGASIPIHTGQADSEILSVSDDNVLYRVNQQILEAPISGGQIGKSVLLVDDENVPQIHWAFWGSK